MSTRQLQKPLIYGINILRGDIMKNKCRLTYMLLFLLFLGTEVLIALFVRDNFIRPYVGDMLVTVVICLFLRAFTPIKSALLPLFVFLFSALVEIGQYFDFVALLGLSDNRFISVLLGRTFSPADIICYGVGCLVFFASEALITQKKRCR